MTRSWPILRLLVLQIVVFAIPVALLIGWTVTERRAENLRQAEATAGFFADSYARELSLLVKDSGELLEALRELPAVHAMFRDQCPEGVARELPVSLRRYGNLLLVDAGGEVVCALVSASGAIQTFTDREWFQAAVRDEGVYVSRAVQGRILGRWVVVVAIPVADSAGGATRALALTLDLLTLSESLHRTTMPADAVVTIMDDSRTVLARSEAPEQWIGREAAPPATSKADDSLDGVPRLYGSVAVEGAPWTVHVGLPVEGVISGMQTDLNRTALIAASAAIALGLLAVWMSATLGNPVRRLAAAVRHVRLHGGHAVKRVRGPREIEEVVHEFDRLLASQAETLREIERSEQRYRATFEQAPVGIVHQDNAGRYLRVNHRFGEMLGHEPQSLLGRHDHELTHPDDRLSNGALYRRLLAGDIALGNLQKRYLRANGDTVWADVTVSRVGEAGEDALFISVVEDVTLARQAARRRTLAATVFENATEGILIADEERRIQVVNKAFTELTGLPEDEVVGRPIGILRTARHPEHFYDAIWDQIRRSARWQGELWLPRRGGGQLPTLMTLSAVEDEPGRIASYVSVFSDLSREKEAEAERDHLVHHDPLTQLPNRRLFNARLEHTIQLAYRDPEKHFSLLYIDLDDFKVVNDSLGHEAGDQLLIEFARRVRATVRSDDTVARMGGDEFMVLLEGAGTANEISRVISKLLEAVQTPFIVAHQEVFVAASIGVAIFPLDAEDGATLVRNADVAMYRAKDKGKNRFEFYEASMSARAMERLGLANDLRRALDGGQFYVVYQPKVTAGDGRIVGFEALLRWRHPERGEIAADRFVQIAEETGLIHPIGRWVLDHATACMAGWRSRGLAGVSIAVNLSAHEIAHPRLLEHVQHALATSGLPAAALELELTESALIRDPARIAPLLKVLSRMGISIAIDDFGTGYSSLSYLRQYRVHVLKIDRSFVAEIEGSQQARVIPQAVVALGRALKLRTVAEGVETEGQAEILRGMGCDLLQGYGIGRPLDQAATEELLRSRGMLDQATA